VSLSGSLGNGFVVERVGVLSAAIERLSRGGVDVVLLDLDLPDSQGIETLERLNAFAPDVPIIVLASGEDLELAVRAVQTGAQDYLVRGQLGKDLLERAIHYAIERHQMISSLKALSLIDDLTGLYNRRGFNELAEQHIRLAGRGGRSLTLIYFDLDAFKRINEEHGYHIGDRALYRVTEIMKRTFRGSDLLARLGGDEFAILAIGASADDAEMVVRRFRTAIDRFNDQTDDPFRLSVSVGVARYTGEGAMRLDDFISRADLAMYEEKLAKAEVPE
jgi:diguanylate cyclase (GGDEF)-like protein